MIVFDFYNPNRRLRPTAAMVVKRWKDAGRPDAFRVDYGNGNVEFTKHGPRWGAYGFANFKTDPIIAALNLYAMAAE